MTEVRPTPPPVYRREGDLEDRFDIEKLPPTPISDEAREKLTAWGFTQEQILELQHFTASFRYDRCVEKIERLVESDVFVLSGNGGLRVELPSYYDLKGKLDGQCGDIARQFIIQAEFSGFLADTNEALALPDKMRVVLGYCVGQSRTHFSHPNTTHLWNSIAIVDEGGALVDKVLVDAAFQIIQTWDESGYKASNAIHGIKGIGDAGLEAKAKLGQINTDSTSGGVALGESIILGISNTRKYAYGLGFVARVPDQVVAHADVYSVTPENIIPIIQQIRDTSVSDVYFLNPDTQELSSSAWIASIDPVEVLEIRKMLELAQKFKYNFNPDEYPRTENGAYSISFRP